jgi:biopolymer transport protein ExbD
MVMEPGTGGDEFQRKPMAEINVIPLVDVMLVLLVVFIVTAPLLTQAVKLELPQANNQPNTPERKQAELSVQRNGTLFWDGQPISETELATLAARLAQQDEQPEIQLRGDSAVPYGEMARILSLLSRQGLVQIALVTEPVAAEK